jgi:hypothetical protein
MAVCLSLWLPLADVHADPPRSTLSRERRSLRAVCGKCHNLELVTDAQKSFDNWQDTLQTMIDRGARGTDQQYKDILYYLHRTQSTINVNAADASELQIVLNVSAAVAQGIIARRECERIKDLDDLKSIAGVDAASLNARARLIFF